MINHSTDRSQFKQLEFVSCVDISSSFGGSIISPDEVNVGFLIGLTCSWWQISGSSRFEDLSSSSVVFEEDGISKSSFSFSAIASNDVSIWDKTWSDFN